MATFGVHAGIEAVGHLKQVPKPRGIASVAEVRQRAAQYSDIVDVASKRRLSQPPSATSHKPGLEVQAVDIDAQRRRRPLGASLGASRSARGVGVLPADAAAYDRAPAGNRRAFFDGAVHAERYARLLGRPDAEGCEEEPLPSDPRDSALAQLEGALPLHVARVIEALLPGKSDKAMQGMPQEVFHRIRAQVMHMVIERMNCHAHEEEHSARAKRPSHQSSQSTFLPSSESVESVPELERPLSQECNENSFESTPDLQVELQAEARALAPEETQAMNPFEEDLQQETVNLYSLTKVPSAHRQEADLPRLLSPSKSRGTPSVYFGDLKKQVVPMQDSDDQVPLDPLENLRRQIVALDATAAYPTQVRREAGF